MLNETVRKAAALLGASIGEVGIGVPEFGDARYEPVRFDASNFRDIAVSRPSCTLAFVDGGNQEILHAPDFSVQLVRVGSTLFRAGDRVAERKVPGKVEFFCVAQAVSRDGELMYEATLLPLSNSFLPFMPEPSTLTLNSRDESLSGGRFRTDISVVGAAARRFSEWLVLSAVLHDELSPGDIAVRDGTLQSAVTNESALAGEAFDTAAKKGAILTALAKTSRLLTSTGLSLLAAVGRLARGCGQSEKSWYYYPIVKNTHPEHRAEIFACRLHPTARYIFRFEILREQAAAMDRTELDRVLSELAFNSRDMAFPGYPYGLVDVDALSRVKNSEREMLAALFATALAERGEWETVQRHLGATDAHDILDEL
jgi:hypothetical protein